MADVAADDDVAAFFDGATKALGGLDALGGPKTDNMYHAGWAWAGDTPFHHTKLVASQGDGDVVPQEDGLAVVHLHPGDEEAFLAEGTALQPLPPPRY